MTSERRDAVAKSKRPNSEPEQLLPCPPELSPRAREKWDEILRELPAVVRLKNIDSTVLVLFCEAYAQWRAAMDAISTYGAVIKSPNGFPVQSPYVSIAHHHEGVMIKLAAELGLTPASRNKVPLVRDDPPDDVGLPPLNL